MFSFNKKNKTVFMELRKIRKCLLGIFSSTLQKIMNSSASTSETSLNLFLFALFHGLFPLKYVFTYAVGNQISNRKFILLYFEQ